ncbi:MAG: M3 family metallopeptidase, partial [Candidatus Accumulibacter sp.]|nr:M3 family metallopeptidase [Accumulibacter sp.]
MNDNPLLDFSGLPRFDAIVPANVQPAVGFLLEENRALVRDLTRRAEPPTWDAFVEPLTDAIERLSRMWGIVAHLHSVDDIPEWREAYNRSLPEVTRFYAELGQNAEIFAAYKSLRAGAEYAGLSAPRRRIIDNEIRDFRLSGADLPEDQKPRFQAISEELASLSARFSENLLDATNAFSEWIRDEEMLSGLPRDVREAAREAAEKGGHDSGWIFTLHMPSYLPLMQYADDRALRARFYRAYATRASEFGPEKLDNTPLIRRLLHLRREEARMLGFETFAEVSLVTKMAESVPQALAFLRELAAKAKPTAEKDLAELEDFAKESLGVAPLEPWDIPYISEKLLQARYAFSEHEVRQYFTVDKVLTGLFRVVETLYAVRIVPDSAPVWHEDVRFFRLENTEGRSLGHFYLDLYARETKRGGAWMDEAITRRRAGHEIQTPVAYLNCNFSRPVRGEDGVMRPATLTHDDVITLFHEAGHVLHHLLTRMEDLDVSGINGVEWDAVELPSQFMENYCWEWRVVREMSAHVDTGEPLPRELFEKMLAARNFQSGLSMVRQLEFALFDLRLHSDFAPSESVLDLLDEVRREVAVVFPPDWHRFPNSFSHIFAGGYAAGYFSYKWAEVLSADCYAAFEEAGDPFDPATGRRFLEEILSVGGSRPAIESFRAFRQRDPRPDALLRHYGMDVNIS